MISGEDFLKSLQTDDGRQMMAIAHTGELKIVGRSWQAEHVCSLNLTSISYSFIYKGRKVLQFWNFDEKRAITPKWVIGITLKLQGR